VIFDSFITRSIEAGDSRAETVCYRNAMSQSSILLANSISPRNRKLEAYAT
jgi:hypothetical protein